MTMKIKTRNADKASLWQFVSDRICRLRRDLNSPVTRQLIDSRVTRNLDRREVLWLLRYTFLLVWIQIVHWSIVYRGGDIRPRSSSILCPTSEIPYNNPQSNEECTAESDTNPNSHLCLRR